MLFFFFNDTATTEIYTLSLHDALPISYVLYIDQETAGEAELPAGADTRQVQLGRAPSQAASSSSSRSVSDVLRMTMAVRRDRKSTRLNSSHSQISYAVFCLKKKKTKTV